MSQLIVISWRDIPAQVIVKQGRKTAKFALSDRFHKAIDRAAMRAGKTSSDAYMNDWVRSVPQICGDDLQAEAQAALRGIEAKFSDDDLLTLIRAHGHHPKPALDPRSDNESK